MIQSEPSALSNSIEGVSMRSILFMIVFVLFLIISVPFIFLLRLIGLFNRRFCAAASQKIVNGAFRLVLKVAGAKITVLGTENIPKDRAVLFTANHRSYADIPLGYTTTPHLTGFIAKKEIAKVPSLSWWMVNMNCLFLDRNDTRKALKTILKAIDNVKAGYSMFVMPEGTRNHNEEMLPFKEGTFKIAEKSGCPIIPVAISNSDALYELHKPWIRSAKVVIRYGEPIETKDLSKEDLCGIGAKVRDRIAVMLEEDKKYCE